MYIILVEVSRRLDFDLSSELAIAEPKFSPICHFHHFLYKYM